jgi:ribonuclease-3
MAVAEKAYRYLKENKLLFTWVDEIGEPSIDRAINQLQELYQKGYIGEPWYDFAETYDDNGNPVWRCECHVLDFIYKNGLP